MIGLDNPSPGNKQGGLTNILEKSLGAVAKGGTAGEALRAFNRDPVVMESLEKASIKVRDQARDGGADANHPNNWAPRGSLGLFLTRGRSSFRNVEIEPLSP